MVAVYNYDYVAKFIVIGDMGCGKSSLLHCPNMASTHVERFRSVTRSYYRGSIGTILVYDITNRETFESLERWLSDARQLTPAKSIFVLVGNKADEGQRREVSFDEGKAYADENGMLFAEASAKTGSKVETIFMDLASQILDLVNSGKVNPASPDSGVQSMKPRDAHGGASGGSRTVNVGSSGGSPRFVIGGMSCC
ncbi:Ras- protein Rab-14 [Coemansia sp. RSA 1822]|nr:Ras- protein Rab-14 [Coemansia sp. RSA 720]KAJ2565532.1 Ras- protein Rab-14 [Coemansia sp. RSA 1822]